MEKERKEKVLTGCLLKSGTTFPQRDVIVCGLCPTRSDMIGNLAEFCRNSSNKEVL